MADDVSPRRMSLLRQDRLTDLGVLAISTGSARSARPIATDEFDRLVGCLVAHSQKWIKRGGINRSRTIPIDTGKPNRREHRAEALSRGEFFVFSLRALRLSASQYSIDDCREGACTAVLRRLT